VPVAASFPESLAIDSLSVCESRISSLSCSGKLCLLEEKSSVDEPSMQLQLFSEVTHYEQVYQSHLAQ
jgi:hypothetical protein